MWLVLAGLISLTLSPSVCHAPCNVTLTIKVEPARDNERVVVQFLEDGETYRVSDMDYSNGGPKTVQITYPGVPSGEYQVIVSLHKHDGKSWVAGSDRKPLRVTDVNFKKN